VLHFGVEETMSGKRAVLGNQGFVELVNHSGGDADILRAARVSYDGDRKENSVSRDKKLIKYLLANRHTSPFEHVNFTFHVKAPIFVARQWMRHRAWSYNEISARYTAPELDCYYPHVWRGQSEDNKQASDGVIDPSAQEEVNRIYQKAMYDYTSAYLSLINFGVARELARMVLPVSAMTRFYATVDLHNLLHFIELREHPHAQVEIQEYAVAMRELIAPLAPWTIEAWNEIHTKGGK
jgi:thymidylate synthase (FAD)